MAQMIVCKHCGRNMPKLVDSSFTGDDFETIERHLCVSPSVNALLREGDEERKSSEAPPSETAA